LVLFPMGFSLRFEGGTMRIFNFVNQDPVARWTSFRHLGYRA
jgi:hypothetical protein